MSEEQAQAANETEGAVAVAEADTQTVDETPSPYLFTVEDAGPAVKKVSVEIPEEVIRSKLDEQMKELRRDVQFPGFRAGHAPKKLLEKRFGGEVKERVRGQLISDSFEKSLEKQKLHAVSEPQFKDLDSVKLPDSGSMQYSFEVEVRPEMTLPPLTGIAVKKARFEIKDENVDLAMKNLREQQGTLIPVEDRGIEAGDYVTADVKLTAGEDEVVNQPEVSIVARAARLAGIDVPELASHLAGAKSGETRTFTAQGPQHHPQEKVRGVEVQFAIAVKDIKKLEPIEITPEFLEELGFANETELRDALREQMVERITFDVAQDQRNQIRSYLNINTQVELPAKLSASQSDRVTQRRAMELLRSGMTKDVLMSNIDVIRADSVEAGKQELKMLFILQKIADDMNIDVGEPELNGRIAMIAAQQDSRPETVKERMSKDGSLQNLYMQMREEKTLDEILKSATVEEVEPQTPAPTPTEA